MKNKALIIILFILFALPIPVAILGALISFILFVSSLILERSPIEIIVAAFGVIIGSTYLVTYILSLIKTRKENKISIKTFLPMAHCLLPLVFLLLLKPEADYISI